MSLYNFGGPSGAFVSDTRAIYQLNSVKQAAALYKPALSTPRRHTNKRYIAEDSETGSSLDKWL